MKTIKQLLIKILNIKSLTKIDSSNNCQVPRHVPKPKTLKPENQKKKN